MANVAFAFMSLSLFFVITCSVAKALPSTWSLSLKKFVNTKTHLNYLLKFVATSFESISDAKNSMSDECLLILYVPFALNKPPAYSA